MFRSRLVFVSPFFSLMLFTVGCAKKLPVIVPTEGVVTIDGKPLANATVTFVPQLDRFGDESNSVAITDEAGRFTLNCNFNNAPGAVEGEHIVLVTESPLPDKLRASQDGNAVERYRISLGNRPIPPAYSSVSQSPLRVTVKAGQDPIPLALSR